MLSQRKIIMGIITAHVPVNKVASVLEYLERGYGSNWTNRNEVAVDTYRYSVGTGRLQKGLLIVELINWLTEWCRGVLEKLTGPQVVKKFPHLIESESSLPSLHKPATCLCLQPDQSTHHKTTFQCFLQSHVGRYPEAQEDISVRTVRY